MMMSQEEKDKFKGNISVEECVEIMTAIVDDPGDIIGETKDEVIEFIKDNIGEYNTMVVLSTLIVTGVNAMQMTKEIMEEEHAKRKAE